MSFGRNVVGYVRYSAEKYPAGVKLVYPAGVPGSITGHNGKLVY